MRATLTALTVIATTLVGGACYTLKPVTIDYLGTRQGSRVWVTNQDESVVVVNDGQVFRGKLVGFVDGKYRELDPAQLRQLKVRKMAAARTVALVSAATLAFAIGAVSLSGHEGTFDPCVGNDECEDG